MNGKEAVQSLHGREESGIREGMRWGKASIIMQKRDKAQEKWKGASFKFQLECLRNLCENQNVSIKFL